MRKKLFAILMSAMMMVTFMPAMAFADADTNAAKLSFSADHKTVTATYGTESVTVKTDREFKKGTGQIDVSANADAVKAAFKSDLTLSDNAKTAIAEALNYTAETYDWEYQICTVAAKWENKGTRKNPNWKFTKATWTKGTTPNTVEKGPSGGIQRNEQMWEVNDVKDLIVTDNDDQDVTGPIGHYYDLTGATLVNATSGTLATTLKAAQYSANKVDAIKVVEPADLVLPGHTADTAVITELTGWTVKFSNGLTETEDAALSTAAYTDREVNWTVSATPIASYVNNKTIVYFEGTFPTAKQTIKAETPTLGSVNLYKDAVKAANAMDLGANNYVYDAAEHTVVTESFDGIQVTFQKLGADGKYADVEGNKVTFKDVTTAAGNYKAVIGWTDAAKAKVDPAIEKAFSISVTKRGVSFARDAKDGFVYANETVDPYAYIVANVTGDTADKKIATADAETLKALAKDLYTATATTAAHDDTAITVTFKKNTFKDAAAWKVVTDKYANYNFGTLDEFNAAAEFTAVPLKVKESKANKVEIYNMTKTLKAKALKKAKKSFAINAEADSDTAITFKKVAGSSKLSVKDAKVVVKKGTKKGTYKIKVKATAAAGNGYAKATTVQVIKVKVK